MVLSSLHQLTPGNISTYCFSPTKGRRALSILSPSTGKWEQQVYGANSICDFSLEALVKSKQPLSEEQVTLYSDPLARIEAKKEEIEGHLDRRVQLFFQQALLCHDTPFFYEAQGAEDQIGKGKTLKVSPKTTYHTQAAHSSTFPCLYASPWNADGTSDKSRRFVFLKGSHAYSQHNATVELPREVNQTDTALDGKEGEKKVRAKALQILNRCAQGDMGPVQATKKFIAVFEKELTTFLGKYPEEDLKHRVATIYLAHLQQIKSSLSDSDAVFDTLMGVKLDETNEKGKLLREVVYKRKFALIQKDEFIQSQIAKKILGVQQAMFQKKNTTLRNLDYRLRYALLHKIQAGPEYEKGCLEKLFCTSLAQLEWPQASRERLEKFQWEFLTESQRTLLESLLRDLRALFRELRVQEFQFRAGLFKDLRGRVKEWTQQQFVASFKRAYPDEPMSQAMVSRLEQPSRLPSKPRYRTPESQRKIEMSVEKATKIADTFGIDAGLFLPALFTSSSR